jgi:hypothetical protein
VTRLLLAGLAGGAVLFVWDAVSRTVLPWPDRGLKQFSHEWVVADAVTRFARGPGMYALPHPTYEDPVLSDTMNRALAERSRRLYRTGPVVFASARFACGPPPPAQWAKSFLIQVLAALPVAWLLGRLAPAGFGARWSAVLVFALAACAAVHLPYWNWWNFSTRHTAVTVADALIGWGLAGLPLAAIVRPRTSVES